MRVLPCLLLLFCISGSFAAEMVPVSVGRSDTGRVERVVGRCDPESNKLVCHLVETTIIKNDAACKVSSRQYVITLDQQGPQTWGMWTVGSLCRVTEVVTAELAPTPTPLHWPGILKYTIKSTVDKNEKSEFCATLKDETYIYTKAETFDPKKLKCGTVEFSAY